MSRSLLPLQYEHPDTRRDDAAPRSHPALMFFGVLLPTFTIALEASTGFCKGVFFDPIPTHAHIALATTVPTVLLIAWLVLRSGQLDRYRVPLLIGLGFAIPSACYFTALYARLLPAALLTTLIGIGFLPLTPLLSLISCLSVVPRLHDRDRPALTAWLWPGVAVGAAAVAGVTMIA